MYVKRKRAHHRYLFIFVFLMDISIIASLHILALGLNFDKYIVRHLDFLFYSLSI